MSLNEVHVMNSRKRKANGIQEVMNFFRFTYNLVGGSKSHEQLVLKSDMAAKDGCHQTRLRAKPKHAFSELINDLIKV